MRVYRRDDTQPSSSSGRTPFTEAGAGELSCDANRGWPFQVVRGVSTAGSESTFPSLRYVGNCVVLGSTGVGVPVACEGVVVAAPFDG